MPLAHPVTPYAATPKAPSRLGLLLAIASTLTLCVPVAALGLLGPKFAEIFRDFGLQLPAYTRLLLDIGNALRTPIGIAIVGVVIFVWFMAVCTTARRHRSLAHGMLIFAILFSLVVFATSIIAFHMPINEMIEQLQQ